MLDKCTKVVVHKNAVRICSMKLDKILSDSEFVLVGTSQMLNKSECYDLDFYARDSIYKCNAYIIDTYNEYENKCYKFQTNSPFKREDRRKYQRYPCREIISYCVLPESQVRDIISEYMGDAWKDIDGVQWVKRASLEDIGGGGLRFTSRQELKKGTYLACTLDFSKYNNQFEDKLDFAIMCEVVHIEKIHSERNLYDVRLKYIGITEQQREKLIRFVFWLERQKI